MKNKLPLSIIILAHRDDQRLRNAIASAQFAEQVLVVDVSDTVKLKKISKDITFKKITL